MTAMGTTTIARRLAGRQASRPRALITSVVAGVGVGVLAYRWLRSGDEDDAG